VRSFTILCAGILALSFLSAPASAEPTTSNTVFAIFDLGGFHSDGTGEGYYNYYSSNILIINIASLGGTIDEFGGITFNTIDISDLEELFDMDIDLSEASFFILGHITGSDHLVLSDAEGDPEPIPDGFEDGLVGPDDPLQNGGDLGVEDPGSANLLSPSEFEDILGTPIETFTEPDPDVIPFDPVGTVGGEVDLLGFTDPIFLVRITLIIENGQIVGMQVPEPGLALLAVLGVAGAAIARRRRRRQAA